MSDGDVEEEGDPIQGEAKIRPLTILGASLGYGLQAGPAKERNKKLQDDGVARGDRAAPKILADHKMIWQELIATSAVGIGDGGGG
jgi:hypothetical protein